MLNTGDKLLEVVEAWPTRHDGEDAILQFAGASYRGEVTGVEWARFFKAVRVRLESVDPDVNAVHDRWRLIILLSIAFKPSSPMDDSGLMMMGMVIVTIEKLALMSSLPAQYELASLAMVVAIKGCVDILDRALDVLAIIATRKDCFPEFTCTVAQQLLA